MTKIPRTNRVTDEGAKEVTEFVKEICDMWYEEFVRVKPQLKGYWKKIMTFFRLPHTELHDRYMKIMSEPARLLRQKQETISKRTEMNDNIKAFIRENFIQPQDTINVRYWIIDMKATVFNLTGEKDVKIQIWIPYWNSKLKANKFWKWMSISKTKTPELFNEIEETYPTFKWEADLLI